jgi:hypothetical protein
LIPHAIVYLLLQRQTRVIIPFYTIPIDSGLILPFAGSVLVCGREQLLL